MEKLSQRDASANLIHKKRESTQLVWTKDSLRARLAKGPDARRKFVESQVVNEIASQIRGLRHENGWSQPSLADKVGTKQSQIYRLENTRTAKPTLTTLKKLAAAFDVGLVVRFVPFGEMVDWLSGTPRLNRGISSASRKPLSFQKELALLEKQRAHVEENAYWGKAASLADQMPLGLLPPNVIEFRGLPYAGSQLMPLRNSIPIVPMSTSKQTESGRTEERWNDLLRVTNLGSDHQRSIYGK
jgi:transcriptional regulator with XRE-family HTH domain